MKRILEYFLFGILLASASVLNAQDDKNKVIQRPTLSEEGKRLLFDNNGSAGGH